MQKKIEELKFAVYNPREITKHDFEALKRSIKEFGFVEPVVVNKDNTIIGGHMRVRAAKELGIAEVPCVFVDLDDTKAKLLNLALNKISGDWDESKLAEVLYNLKEIVPDDLELAGFTDLDIDSLIQEVAGEEISDVPEVDIEGAGKNANILVSFYFQTEEEAQKILNTFESRSRIIDGKQLFKRLKL